MAATRQGRVRVQAAHSAARSRRHRASAEPPGRPTVARTRTATTGRPASVPARSWSGSSPKWARMACRSAGLRGRTDPLSRRRRRRATVESWPSRCSFLLMLAGGPLGAAPATLLVSSRLGWAFAGRLGLAGAVGGPLLGLDPLDGGADLLPVPRWVGSWGSGPRARSGSVMPQLPLPVMGPVDLLGGHRQATTRHRGWLVVAAPQPAKHAARLAAGGLLLGGQALLGLLAVGGGPGQLAAVVAGGLVQLVAEPVPLSP